MTTIADTLVLKIEEHDSVHGFDTTLYILYDNELQTYIIRGRRRNCSKQSFNPYSYECKNVNDLVQFIEFSIETKNQFYYTLYNNINLPINSMDITYDSLIENDCRGNEIVAYDSVNYFKKNLLKYLKVLKNVGNYY